MTKVLVTVACSRKIIGCQAFSKGYIAAEGNISGDFDSCR
jgi:hypothetical protein